MGRMTTSGPVVPPLTRGLGVLAAAFLASGAVHLARPEVFTPTIPTWLPAPRRLVLWSGVAEVACGAALFAPRTRRLAGWASALLLIGVWPANAQMAVTADRRVRLDPGSTGARVERVVTLLRLPLQVPLIRTALRAARH